MNEKEQKLAKPRFWHMQLHPGKEAQSSREDVLKILKQYGVVGMGDESDGWDSRGQTKRFKEDVHEGDIIGIREKGFLALVRVTGVCRKNEKKDELNWFDIVRPIEILSEDAGEYRTKYKAKTGNSAHDNLYLLATLCEVKPKCKNKFLQFWYSSVMGLNVSDSENSDLNKDSETSHEGSEDDNYTKEKFLDEVFMSSDQYNELVGLLERKKNIILQGAPGVGKTFAAQRLAYSMIGSSKDKSRIEFVQFHQSYSYENFICGYKPTADGGFKLEKGVFLKFCEKAKAEKDPKKKYFFIIDEINRGNFSKIFGELLVLIECDKRGKDDYAVKLAYGDGEQDKRFCVPENLYLIGLMNTADRSLAMIDYALRRRFAFFTIEPALDKDKFRKQLKPELKGLVDAVKDINGRIEKDPSLGRGFLIGHSYFCGENVGSAKEILDYEIAPMLKEYWFENPEKAEEEIEKLNKAISA